MKQNFANISIPEDLIQAALAGDADEQFCLACFYELKRRIDYRYEGIAIHWFTRAAEQGLSYAQLALGYYFDDKRQNELAKEWYTRAAAQGNKDAQKALARLRDDTPLSD